MSRGGKNRLTVKEKDLRGTTRGQRARPSPEAPAPVPPPPDDLPRRAKAVWEELATQAQVRRSFTPARLSSFRLLAETLAKTREKGVPPYVLDRLVRLANDLLRDFGLTPLREELAAPPAPEDEAERFFFGELRAIPGGRRS